MKTTKSFLTYFAAMLLLLSIYSQAQQGTSVMELLMRHTWVLPNSELLEISYTDRTITITLRAGVSPATSVFYYYLSETPDTLFQPHKIGTATKGRFINRIYEVAFRDNLLNKLSVIEILELNENELNIEAILKTPVVGGGAVRYVPKPR